MLQTSSSRPGGDASRPAGIWGMQPELLYSTYPILLPQTSRGMPVWRSGQRMTCPCPCPSGAHGWMMPKRHRVSHTSQHQPRQLSRTVASLGGLVPFFPSAIAIIISSPYQGLVAECVGGRRRTDGLLASMPCLSHAASLRIIQEHLRLLHDDRITLGRH